MKKTLIFITLQSIMLFSESIDFKQLALLASQDLKTNIYLDKNLNDYSVDFNIAEHQKRGEVYEFFKIVLLDNNLSLQYNKKGDFYFVREEIALPLPPAPAPAIHPSLQKHYYTYKIKNITNIDVLDSLSIFDNVKYKYLKQSDIIAFSATNSQYDEIIQILEDSDRNVLAKSIKLTIFSVNKNKIKTIGTQINNFGFGFGNTVQDSLSADFSNILTFKGSFDINAYMSLLSNWGVTTISQSPTLLLTNGIEASLDSVANVRYSMGTSSVDNQGGSTVSQNYQYKDVGLKIKINPKIKKDFIYLDLSLISEDFIGSDLDNPIVGKISYKNSFKVQKGKPLLLTGINKTIIKNLKSNVPFLSKLPFLGFVFKGNSSSKEEQNVNILIEVL